jgi:hypothetical protein
LRNLVIFAQPVIAACDALTVEAHSPAGSISAQKVCIRGPKGVGVRFYKFLQERSNERQAIQDCPVRRSVDLPGFRFSNRGLQLK